MLRKRMALLICVLFLLGMGGLALATGGETLDEYPCFVEVPLIRQGSPYTCGIACLHSLLRWAAYDMDINDAVLMEACGTTPENGTSYARIVQYLEETGLFSVSWNEGMTVEQLKGALDGGGCVMMPLQAWEYKPGANGESVLFSTEDYANFWAGGHWVIACGYRDDAVLFMDPATGGCYTQMPMDALEQRWHDSPDYVSEDQPFQKFEHCGITVFCRNGAAYNSDAVYPLL